MSLKSSIETAPPVSNQKCATAGVLDVRSDTELELASGDGQPVTGNPDMTDPQVALQLEQLSQGLGAASHGAGLIKAMKDVSDALT